MILQFHVNSGSKPLNKPSFCTIASWEGFHSFPQKISIENLRTKIPNGGPSSQLGRKCKRHWRVKAWLSAFQVPLLSWRFNVSCPLPRVPTYSKLPLKMEAPLVINRLKKKTGVRFGPELKPIFSGGAVLETTSKHQSILWLDHADWVWKISTVWSMTSEPT